MFGLVKHNPFGLFSEVERHFNQLYDDYKLSREHKQADYEIYEGKDDFLLVCGLPGYKREEIDIEVKDNTLSINAEHKENKKTDDKEDSESKEVIVRSMSRAFTISDKIETDKISVELKDGLLRIILPKAEEAKPRKIEIK